MKSVIFALGSVTYAIKAAKLIKREGIYVRQTKLDNTPQGRGCTHGIEIYEKDLYDVIYILRNNDIEYRIVNGKDDIP